MLEKKLVEKEVEVTVTKLEKRIFDIYTFEGEEYEADELMWKLERKAVKAFKDILESCRDRKGLSCNTHFRTVKERIGRYDVEQSLDQLKSIVYYYDLISELGG